MCCGTEQAGLADLGRRVGGQLDITVELHRDQRVPALAFDLGDGADVDVADPDAGVRLDVVHVGHLGLDRERTGPRALDARQAEASSARASRSSRTAAAASTATPATTRTAPRRHHDPPPGGTIMPVQTVGRVRSQPAPRPPSGGPLDAGGGALRDCGGARRAGCGGT